MWAIKKLMSSYFFKANMARHLPYDRMKPELKFLCNSDKKEKKKHDIYIPMSQHLHNGSRDDKN